MDALLLLLVILFGLISAASAVLAYRLLLQHGRLLLRIDELEERLDAIPHMSAHRASDAGAQLGLPPGSKAPAFRLPDLEGHVADLPAFGQRRTLLVHWSTTCRFCDQAAAGLADLQDDLKKKQVELVLVSQGDPAANRAMAEKYGLRVPILLQDASNRVELFKNTGTPVAYLVDESGRIAEPLVVGADRVLDLARRAANGRRQLATERPLGESRIDRNGLTPGSIAPPFTLPDLQGTLVALQSYLGDDVLLVFSDPDCGPCGDLLPDLERIHRTATSPNVVVVSRGSVDANKRKIGRQPIGYPILLQRHWEVSREYAMFATPIAYLIDEGGRIATNVAVGRDQIVALASDATPKAGNDTERKVGEAYRRVS